MSRTASYLLSGILLLAVGCQYGPSQDHGKFKSTALTSKGQRVLFTYHDLVYRPAKGMSAFPDGGIPKYIRDQSFFCSFDRSTQTLSLVMKEQNSLWSHGQGALHIVTARGNAALLSQSGQTRKDLARHLTQHHLVTIRTGKTETFTLSEDLKPYGRKAGAIYLVDDDGLLLISTTAIDAPPKSKDAPELWVRRPGGEYFLAAATHHYQTTVENDLIYWKRDDRNYYAFNLTDKSTRILKDYRPQGMQPVNQGVSIGSRGKTIDFGVRTNGSWHYSPLPVTPDTIINL